MAPLIALLLLALPAAAQDAGREPQFDVVSFEAQASREVHNDQLVAVLAVEQHGPDPAALADTVNRRMAEALKLAGATRLIGKLQQNMVVRSMAVRLSPEARRAAEDGLIAEAIAAFRARAELVREAMKAGGYRVRSLNLGTAGGSPPRPLEMRAMAAPVAVEAGVSQVTVIASGSIQLR